MEIIIFVAVVVVAALLWSGYVKAKKTDSDQAIDNWTPPKEMTSSEKEWPFGEKLPEGKIHVKVSDLAPVLPVAPAEPTGSENRVEAPAPVVEQAPAKKAAAKKPAAKKTAAKPAAAKKVPAKKKSV